ncbi:hypothetical protein EHP00_1937 [Ecytonucleospora hepatopenaei]|uniref:Uncharacterized protein n=1 Tax=Ecytonucleospora hepatopenaei TaxID=646526 RepID=A0A1W0E2S3_9MICR|nr:hypothetical protein EHP00_1937 [Ecytonucleospora hepatopenaei]
MTFKDVLVEKWVENLRRKHSVIDKLLQIRSKSFLNTFTILKLINWNYKANFSRTHFCSRHTLILAISSRV